MQKPTSVDEYISWFPAATQTLLKQFRATIREAAPQAEEIISYATPAYKHYGILVYFAAFKHHIGFYPTGKGIAKFKKELATYKTGKGSIQFPIDQPLPLELITKIVEFRVLENSEKQKSKKK